VRARKPLPSIPAAPELVAAAVGCGARRVQALLSVDSVVASAGEKAQLASFADAVDMESFTVLGEAARYGVPGAAIRVIGDAADEDLPLDFDGTSRSDGTIDVPKLLRAIAARPHTWPALVPFAFRQRRALGRLAIFLDRFIAVLG
jgi:adenosylhomocysteine nucleosidase